MDDIRPLVNTNLPHLLDQLRNHIRKNDLPTKLSKPIPTG